MHRVLHAILIRHLMALLGRVTPTQQVVCKHFLAWLLCHYTQLIHVQHELMA